jgi:integrase
MLGIQPKKERILFKDFAQSYLNNYIKVSRRGWQPEENRLAKMTEFFEGMCLDEITPLIIEKFRASRLRSGNSKSTVNRFTALLKRMFPLAIQEGYGTENPVQKIKFFSERDTLKERILTPDEEERLLGECSDHLKIIIKVALNTGMRLGEILNLRWSQVDLGERRIRVEKTKSGKFRFININTPLLEVLGELKTRNGHNPFVFFDQRTGHAFKRIDKAFKTARRRADISDLRFYDLRHTFASRLIHAGVDIEIVKSLLGHSSITLTQRYIHSNDEMKKKAVELLGRSGEETAPEAENLLRPCDMGKKGSSTGEIKKWPTHLFSMN